MIPPWPFLEFFCGGGMARMGLAPSWKPVFANDVDPRKAESYRRNFPPADELLVADVAHVHVDQLPPQALLAWASFPCQDLSLAGDRKGFNGKRSSTFWPFWKLIQARRRRGNPIPILVVENVPGAVTSNQGKDLAALLRALRDEDYLYGPLLIDAARFVPQSRPRLFIAAVLRELIDPSPWTVDQPSPPWTPPLLQIARQRIDPKLQENWVWWNLPAPPPRTSCLADFLEDPPVGVDWQSQPGVDRILDLMTPEHRDRVHRALSAPTLQVGAVYKRTRRTPQGDRVQRAEVRFDGLAGCLRTPAGGSSRQTLLVIENGLVRSRLISPRETARLMGVPETYRLPDRYNQAYHLMGDGVVVPAAAWLDQHLLTPWAQTLTQSPSPRPA